MKHLVIGGTHAGKIISTNLPYVQFSAPSNPIKLYKDGAAPSNATLRGEEYRVERLCVNNKEWYCLIPINEDPEFLLQTLLDTYMAAHK